MRLWRWRQVTPRMRWLLGALLLVNLLLAARGLHMGYEEVSDGAESVTSGFTITAGILVTLLVALGVGFLPFAPGPLARTQAFLLLAQGVHAAGHVFRWYYDFTHYDDVLHVLLPMGVGLVFFDLARSRRFLITTRQGPLRVGLLITMVAVATAGLWEIFEFSMDSLLDTREQDNLRDTMIDMIDGLVGGAIAGAYAAWTLRREQAVQAQAQPHSELLD